MKEMHLTEGRNTGFRKILNALERNGSPKPIFETDPERLSFCTTLLIHPEFLHQNEGVNEGVNETLSDKEQAVLDAIKRNPHTSVAKMIKELNISKASIERAIKGLKKRQIIIHEGPAKTGRWIVLK
ncbi:MAG: winged helix-turn-helix transcriptional regulator [Lachnospiraceae bacterium]|nr:winged helix-turn-helix transcriptional regulator [Lachnospiraceae bacterium]